MLAFTFFCNFVNTFLSVICVITIGFLFELNQYDSIIFCFSIYNFSELIFKHDLFVFVNTEQKLK